MDISFFLDEAIQGIPLLVPVVVLVQLLKSFKTKDGAQAIKGNALLLASFGIGLILGTLYMVYGTKPPDGAEWYGGFQYWFGTVIYGITLGGLASGVFETLKALFDKAVEKFFKKGIDQAAASGQE